MTAAPAGLHRVEQIMGTAISLDVRDPGLPAGLLDGAFEYLRDIDRRFSTYRGDSEISRLGRGEIELVECSPDVAQVLELCEQVRRASAGYFDVRRHRPDGGLDPSGLVKGWALENAASLLDEAGCRNYCLNGGGDIVVRGEAAPGTAWRIGIRHPRLADRLATVLAVRDAAVATSGAYERGEHVLDPHTGRPPENVVSVSVVGPRLTFADAYATAAFAMGPTGIAWLSGIDGYEGCSITATDQLTSTPGFARYLADLG